MKRINFILAIHNHQPVGNFNHIFEDAYQKSYLPFINILERHPSIKIALHYSGPLLDWLIEKHPELLERVKKMVEHRQVEMLTGGYYEPVLSTIPDWDKVGQIKALTKKINGYFNTVPKGMWLSERIWEPGLAKPLAESEVEFSMVDDIHFKQVGLTDEQLLGHYITEEEGWTLRLFSISQKLRYLIPFASSPDEIFNYLDSIASEDTERLILMGDDGEKFGLWPNTYDWVYEKGWLEKFFTGLEERKDWIRSITFSQWLTENKAIDRIYLPCGSYSELMEWALPAESGLLYDEFVQRMKNSNEYDTYSPFIKGGLFKNFFVKYSESNNMHKKMLYVSEKINKLILSTELLPNHSTHPDIPLKELWQGQCNCAYWHGIFGGLYLPHLRKAIYEHLIKAEVLIDNLFPQTEIKVTPFDLDKDGEKEVLISTPLINLYFDTHHGGSLFEFDFKPKSHNIINTLTRRKEAYHKKLEQTVSNSKKDRAQSIHNHVLTKEKGLEKYLHYDWYRKVCLLDHFLCPKVNLDEFSKAQYGEEGNFINQPYSVSVKKIKEGIELDMTRQGNVWISGSHEKIEVKKKIVLNNRTGGFDTEYLVISHCDKQIDIIFGVEFNFILPSANSSSCCYHFPELQRDECIDIKGEFSKIKRLSSKDKLTSMEIDFDFGQEAALWCFPIETVSYSEAGFERCYQGSTILPHWRLSLMPGRYWETKIKMRVF